MKIDWNSTVTKKHIAEAIAAGVVLVGAGRTALEREYRFEPCMHVKSISTSSVRVGGKRKCPICAEAEFHQEAELHGCFLVGDALKAGSRRYRFKDCGHEQECRIDDIRKKKSQCKKCKERVWTDEGKEKGLKYLGKGSHGDNKLYQFYECNHQQEITPNAVRDGRFTCSECKILQHISEAKRVGLTIIGKGKNKFYKRYKFDFCGHEQELQHSAVQRGVLNCRKCLHLKIEQEANQAGLKIVGDSKTLYKIYEFNQCGHQQEIRVDQVRTGYFECRICQLSSLDEPSTVYLLHIKNGADEWLKLGYTKNVKSRIKQYGLLPNSEIKTIITKYFDTGREANLYERSLHLKYKKYRLKSREMKVFHTVSGFNECYPLIITQHLTNKLS